MTTKTLMCLAGLCAGLSTTALAGGSNDKIQPDLAERLAGAQRGELIPVCIIMKQQALAFDIDALRAMGSKDDRRAFVIETLQSVAESTQGGVLTQLNAAAAQGDADGVQSLWITNLVAANVTAEVATQIAARPDVDHVALDHIIGPEVFPVIKNPDMGEGGVITAVECGTALMNAPTCWSNGYTGTNIVVGMIDTGTCITHPDIDTQIWTNAGEIPGNNIDDDGNGFKDDIHGWSWDGNGSNSNISDNNGHGSHTAGTVAGDGQQGTQCGMAPDALIQTLKFYNSLSGEVSVWNGIQYGLANDADVLSASLGWLHAWGPQRATWRSICENAFASGVVVVFAAGNEGSSYGIDSVRTPGDVPDMITVGATNCSMNIAGFSSRGPVTWSNVNPYNDWPYPPGKMKPTVSAPGENTVSHNICSGYQTLSGTSMATPHVSGAVALILDANPNLDHYEVKQLLKANAIDRGSAGHDNTYGAGFVDAWIAVQAALDLACTVDINNDGTVNTLDVLAFLSLWSFGNSAADWNNDGTVNTLDVLAFLGDWNAGC